MDGVSECGIRLPAVDARPRHLPPCLGVRKVSSATSAGGPDNLFGKVAKESGTRLLAKTPSPTDADIDTAMTLGRWSLPSGR